jgi:hypothetical protein
VVYLLKARIVKPAEAAVARERLCEQAPVARQWLGDRHVIAATVSHATITEMLEAVFSVRSVPRLNNSAMKSSYETVTGDGLEAAGTELSPRPNN